MHVWVTSVSSHLCILEAMNAQRKTRSVRRSEKRRRIMPPLRGGVNAAPIRLPFPDETALQDRGVKALGEWFVHRFGEEGLELLERGDVLAGHGQVIGADYPYTPGERIWVFRPILDEPSEPIILPIAAENERYVIVEKPHGMATVPKGSHVANSVLVAARRQMGNDLLIAAHRLDLETAGLVLLVKEPQWRGAYQKLFERRAINKTYRAVAPLIKDDCAQLGERWHSELTLHKVEGELKVSVVRHSEEKQAESSEVLNMSHHTAMSEYSCSENALTYQAKKDRDSLDRVVCTPAPRGSAGVTRDTSGGISSRASHPGVSFSYYGEHRGPTSRTQANAVTDVELARIIPHPVKDTPMGACACGERETTRGKNMEDKENLHICAGESRLGVYTLYPHTGFTHQLRVVMNELGAPICGDPLYPRMMSLDEVAQRDYPLQLLAASLEFDDPISGERVYVESRQKLMLE